MTKKSGKAVKSSRNLNNNDIPCMGKGIRSMDSNTLSNKENCGFEDVSKISEFKQPSSQILKRQHQSSREDNRKKSSEESISSKDHDGASQDVLYSTSQEILKMIPLKDVKDSSFCRQLNLNSKGSVSHYRCYLCSRSHIGHLDWEQHLKSKQHQSKNELFQRIQRARICSEEENKDKENCDSTKFGWMQAILIDSCSPVESKKDGGNENNCGVKWTCTLCFNGSSNSSTTSSGPSATFINTSDVLVHCSGKGHIQAMRLYKEHRTIQQYTITDSDRFKFIRIDQKDVAADDMDISAALQANLGVKNYNYKCTLCMASAMPAKSAIDHFFGKIHTAKFERLIREQQQVHSADTIVTVDTTDSTSTCEHPQEESAKDSSPNSQIIPRFQLKDVTKSVDSEAHENDDQSIPMQIGRDFSTNNHQSGDSTIGNFVASKQESDQNVPPHENANEVKDVEFILDHKSMSANDTVDDRVMLADEAKHIELDGDTVQELVVNDDCEEVMGSENKEEELCMHAATVSDSYTNTVAKLEVVENKATSDPAVKFESKCDIASMTLDTRGRDVSIQTDVENSNESKCKSIEEKLDNSDTPVEGDKPSLLMNYDFLMSEHIGNSTQVDGRIEIQNSPVSFVEVNDLQSENEYLEQPLLLSLDDKSVFEKNTDFIPIEEIVVPITCEKFVPETTTGRTEDFNLKEATLAVDHNDMIKQENAIKCIQELSFHFF